MAMMSYRACLLWQQHRGYYCNSILLIIDLSHMLRHACMRVCMTACVWTTCTTTVGFDSMQYVTYSYILATCHWVYFVLHRGRCSQAFSKITFIARAVYIHNAMQALRIAWSILYIVFFNKGPSEKSGMHGLLYTAWGGTDPGSLP